MSILDKLKSGYKEIKKEISSEDITSILNNAKSQGMDIYSKAKKTLENVAEKFSTDNKIDPEKIMNYIRDDSVGSIKEFGEKAVKKVKEIMAEGADKLELVSDEDKQTVYKDIGKLYEGKFPLVFKYQFQDCLDFYNRVDNTIYPETREVASKSLMLQDIKLTASNDIEDLLEYYHNVTKSGDFEFFKGRMDILKRYFAKETEEAISKYTQ